MKARRRGSVYMLILIVTAIVTVIGISSTMLMRLRGSTSASTRDLTAAQYHAFSGAELVLHTIAGDPAWRQTYHHETWEPVQAIDGGGFQWMPVDEVDDDLGDDDADPARIVVWGMAGNAVRKISFRIEPAENVAEAALEKAVHGYDEIRIDTSQVLTVTGAPLSTSGELRNDGMLFGDAEAAVLTGTGSETGDVTVPGPNTPMPSASIFDDYRQMATTLPYAGDFDKMVLTPTVNQYGGGLDPEGIYFIDTAGSDLVIKGSRIEGTLVVDAGSKDVILDNQAFLHHHREDLPVLVLRCNRLLMKLTSRSDSPSERVLSESAWGHNFNPAGAPYAGQADGDQSDVYPCEIDGLVHVVGDVDVDGSPVIRGALLCDGAVRIIAATGSGPQIIHDPQVVATPPAEYVEGGGEVVVVSGSWRQEAN